MEGSEPGVFHWPGFRWLLASAACATLASRSALVVLNYRVYELTHDPLALGWLGLVEAIPAVSLALLGGHFADRRDRRRLVLAADGVTALCALTFAALTGAEWGGVLALYAIVLVAGVARGFSDPATLALEAQVVPPALYLRASVWMSSTWQGCAILGPALGGFAYDLVGPAGAFLLSAGLYAVAWLAIYFIVPMPIPTPAAHESVFRSIAEGVRYVWRDQVLLGSMALDMFAVLFGGAVAMLPIFADQVLHVGATGLGLLNAAPSVGALAVMLWATRRPPGRHAGPTLLAAVAGFGVSMIVFALSESFVLSLAALAFSGLFDGISVIIRKAILRLRSPEALRGRIAAVSMIFIGSSNEIGAFESGVAARLLGTVPSVWLGGLVTLAVVAVTAVAAPALRGLSLESRPGEPAAE